MNYEDKVKLNAEIISRLMASDIGSKISIDDLAELAKEIIEASEKVYSSKTHKGAILETDLRNKVADGVVKMTRGNYFEK